MHTSRDPIFKGDVVVRHDRSFVVIGVDPGRLTLVPLLRASEARHRADVAVGDDLGWGMASGATTDLVAACRCRIFADPCLCLRIGAVGSATRRAIDLAVARENHVTAIEMTGGLGSSLLAQTASSGRRVSAARA